VIAAAVVIALVLALLGAAAAAARPGSFFWAPHALVDGARVQISSSHGAAELGLARDRLSVARQKSGDERQVWIADARRHLEAARAAGADAGEARAVDDEITTLEVESVGPG
jgi:hypothetical protein